MEKEVKEQIEKARKAGKSIGLVQGSWDMFHLGHLCYLQEARKACDFLIVAMDDDEKIRHRKGSNRPIIPLEERYQTIKRLGIADAIIVKHLGEPHWGLIKAVKPDVLVAIKENYSDDEVAELEKICGKVAILPRQATTSTSEIIRRTLIANGAKAIAQSDPRVAKTVDEFKARITRWKELPEPWPQLLNYMERSTDWVTPVAACCMVDGKWQFGVNKIDRSIPKQDYEKRSELLYATVEHSEINLLKKLENVSEFDMPLFVTLFPCDRCIKVLADKGFKKIYYLEDHPENGWSKRSHERAEQAGIETVKVWLDEDGELHEQTDGGEKLSIEDSNEKYGQYKYIDPRNAREQDQLDVMMGYEYAGEDPLAPENVDTDKQELVLQKKHWYVVKNRYPYPEVEWQLVMFAMDPVYDIANVTPEMWAEAQEILNELREKFHLKGGAFCMRFGDTLKSGASLKRVHAHIIVPTDGNKTKFAVGCDRTGIKEGLTIKPKTK